MIKFRQKDFSLTRGIGSRLSSASGGALFGAGAGAILGGGLSLGNAKATIAGASVGALIGAVAGWRSASIKLSQVEKDYIDSLYPVSSFVDQLGLTIAAPDLLKLVDKFYSDYLSKSSEIYGIHELMFDEEVILLPSLYINKIDYSDYKKLISGKPMVLASISVADVANVAGKQINTHDYVYVDVSITPDGRLMLGDRDISRDPDEVRKYFVKCWENLLTCWYKLTSNYVEYLNKHEGIPAISKADLSKYRGEIDRGIKSIISQLQRVKITVDSKELIKSRQKDFSFLGNLFGKSPKHSQKATSTIPPFLFELWNQVNYSDDPKVGPAMTDLYKFFQRYGFECLIPSVISHLDGRVGGDLVLAVGSYFWEDDPEPSEMLGVTHVYFTGGKLLTKYQNKVRDITANPDELRKIVINNYYEMLSHWFEDFIKSTGKSDKSIKTEGDRKIKSIISQLQRVKVTVDIKELIKSRQKDFSLLGNLFGKSPKHPQTAASTIPLPGGDIKIDYITFKELEDNDYWPALVTKGLQASEDVEGWKTIDQWMRDRGFYKNNKGGIVAVHILSDNIKGSNGAAANVIEFSPGTEINTGVRLQYREKFSWVEDFIHNNRSWYKSGR